MKKDAEQMKDKSPRAGEKEERERSLSSPCELVILTHNTGHDDRNLSLF